MNLVVGATGLLGSEICARLVASQAPVRGLVRATSDPLKVERLAALGVDIVRGDLRDAASLHAACRGVTAVIVTASAMPFAYEPGKNTPQTTDNDGICALVRAARANGAQRFVHTSFTACIDEPFPLREAKRASEDCVKESGLIYTILRPNFFMDVWLSAAVGFDFARARATIYGSGRQRISWIAVRDVAGFAVASLAVPAARNAVLELGGPEALSPLEVVAIFERLEGRQFELQFIAEDALKARQQAATDPMEQSFAALMCAYARGAAIAAPDSRGFGVTLTSVQQYAEQVVGAGVKEVPGVTR